MTDLRTAAQQALEALELGYDSAKAEADQYHAAMAGYRQQRHAQMDADVQQIASAITALRAALAETVQEPVAWRWGYRSITTGEMDWRGYVEIAADPNLRSPAIIMQPLYAAPPQRPAEPVQEPQCNPHPKAPHGFLRNASHTEDRYVCECEGWEPYEAGYQAGMEAALRAQS